MRAGVGVAQPAGSCTLRRLACLVPPRSPPRARLRFRLLHSAAKPYASSRIFFAGEYSRSDHPATVHGALLSGRKTATDVASALAGK